MVLKVGVLALQGGFAKHCEMLHRLHTLTLEVRYPEELAYCDGLILPGGESTTIYSHLDSQGFLAPLRAFSQTHPLFGTCAGCIVMARLNILDISVARNAYGRQIYSFTTPLSFQEKQIPALFIRAPLITHTADSVHVLAQHKGSAVLVQQGRHLGATFHPELTTDSTVHAYFLEHCLRQEERPSLLPL